MPSGSGKSSLASLVAKIAVIARLHPPRYVFAVGPAELSVLLFSRSVDVTVTEICNGLANTAISRTMRRRNHGFIAF